MTKIGLIGLGDMGAAVGRTLNSAGHNVLSVFEGRSQDSVRRAKAAGIEECASLDRMIDEVSIILSIVPPGEARAVVLDVADAIEDFVGEIVFADLNAIAPETSKGLASEIAYAGGVYVDGGVIGASPYKTKMKTRIYLSAPDAGRLSSLSTDEMDVRICGQEVGQASGLKMTYAALTKGTAALQAAVVIAANEMDLFEPLSRELEESQSDRFAMMGASVPFLAADSVRFADEMDEIAASFAAVGVTPKFHEGAGDLYRLLAKTPLEAETRETLDRSRTLEEALKSTLRLFVEAEWLSGQKNRDLLPQRA